MKISDISLSKTWYRLQRLSRKLWVRASLVAALALVAAWTAQILGPLVPDKIVEQLGSSAVTLVLQILGTAMLTVTTFSLNVMVTARQAASTQVTPRSHRLLLADTTTQNVLATFLGAFVFALVGLIVVSTGYYGPEGQSVIMGFTLLVIALVVISMLRWIDHLSSLGSMVETTRRVEDAAEKALKGRREHPCLGARPLRDESRISPAAVALRSHRTAYVQHVALARLDDLLGDGSGAIWVVAPPGTLVAEGEPLLYYSGLGDGGDGGDGGDEGDEDDLHDAFTLGEERDFEQDPRFGVIVLSEIAQRALSPGVNDPGTAIDVIGRLLRLLMPFESEGEAREEILYPRIWLPPVPAGALIRDGFDGIARDGAGSVEVQVRLQKALAQLSRCDCSEMAEAARGMSRRALRLSDAEIRLEEDRERLRRMAQA